MRPRLLRWLKGVTTLRNSTGLLLRGIYRVAYIFWAFFQAPVICCHRLRRMNVHFVGGSCYSDFPRVIGASATPILIRSVRTDPKFSFRCVTVLDVLAFIRSVKSNSVGTDQIPILFCRMFLPLILPLVTHLINSIITKSFFLKHWKSAKVFA